MTEDIEQIEHIIQVDDSITVNMKIPKYITILEFKAMTAKISKLFNMSGALTTMNEFGGIVGERPTARRTRRLDKNPDKNKIFTDILYERYINNHSAKEVAEIVNSKYGLEYTAKIIDRKLYYIKSQRKDIVEQVKSMKGE